MVRVVQPKHTCAAVRCFADFDMGKTICTACLQPVRYGDQVFQFKGIGTVRVNPLPLDEGAAEIMRRIEGMTRAERRAYWNRRTEELIAQYRKQSAMTPKDSS